MTRGLWCVVGRVNPADAYGVVFSGLSYRAACCIVIGMRQAGAPAVVRAS